MPCVEDVASRMPMPVHVVHHVFRVSDYIVEQEDVEFVSVECVACTIEFMTLRIPLPTTMSSLPKRSTGMDMHEDERSTYASRRRMRRRAAVLRIMCSHVHVYTRSIDQSLVINAPKYVTSVALKQGQMKAIQRYVCGGTPVTDMRLTSHVVLTWGMHSKGREMCAAMRVMCISPGGIEKQYRCVCKHCGCVLGYSSTPFDEKVKNIFLLPDAIKTHNKMKVQTTEWEEGHNSNLTCAMCHVPCVLCHVTCIMCHVLCVMYHVVCSMFSVALSLSRLLSLCSCQLGSKSRATHRASHSDAKQATHEQHDEHEQQQQSLSQSQPTTDDDAPAPAPASTSTVTSTSSNSSETQRETEPVSAAASDSVPVDHSSSHTSTSNSTSTGDVSTHTAAATTSTATPST